MGSVRLLDRISPKVCHHRPLEGKSILENVCCSKQELAKVFKTIQLPTPASCTLYLIVYTWRLDGANSRHGKVI